MILSIRNILEWWQSILPVIPPSCMIRHVQSLKCLSTVLAKSTICLRGTVTDAYLWSLDHSLQPAITLVHLAADAIPLELCITGQEVPQLVIRLGNCLVVSLLGFLEHLFGLLNLHLAGLNINVC